MLIVVASVLDSVHPLLVESPEMSIQLLDHLTVSLVFSEVRPRIVFVPAHVLYRENWSAQRKIIDIFGLGDWYRDWHWNWCWGWLHDCSCFRFYSLNLGFIEFANICSCWCFGLLKLFIFGNVNSWLCIFEPVIDSIEVKSEAISSFFPSFQTSD